MPNLLDLIGDIDQQREQVRETLEPVNLEYDVFDEDDLAWLEDYGRTQTPNSRRNDNGTVFTSGAFDTIVTKFRRKLERILPGCTQSPDIDGNFFITPHQYGLHNDSIPRWRWEQNGSAAGEYHPWRNILIPLWQAPSDANSQIVFFEQRDLDWAKVYHHNHQGPIATTYPVCRNYAEIDTFYNMHGEPLPWQDRPMEPVEFFRYLDTEGSDIDRFRGLTVETMFDWRPGMAFAFDSWQLHATNKGNPAWHQKSGLLLCFFKKI